jgi:prolipoprotein diacylglyceryltransferase
MAADSVATPGCPDVIVLGRYLVLAGAIRFAIEFIRVNQRILGP